MIGEVQTSEKIKSKGAVDISDELVKGNLCILLIWQELQALKLLGIKENNCIILGEGWPNL